MAVGFFQVEEPAPQSAFAQWPRDADLATLPVVLEPGGARIGPLALPGRVGCGHCALRRMAAAASAHGLIAGGVSLGEVEPADGGGAVGQEPSAGPGSSRGEVEPSPSGRRASRGAVGSVAAAGPSRGRGVERRWRAIPAGGARLEREIRTILRRGPQASPLLDHVLLIDSSGQSALHRVIPLPQCPVCGGAVELPPSTAPRADELSLDDPPETVLAALAGWVDPLTGVIPAVFVEPPVEGGAGLPIVATAAPPHTVGADGALRPLPLGWGKGLTLSGALLSAVGEAIERYAPSLPDPARIVWRRPDDLEGDRLDPREFALYTGEQYARDGFPYVRFDPAVRHPWVRGWWLSGGSETLPSEPSASFVRGLSDGSNVVPTGSAPVWVPAIFAYLALDLGREHLVCQGTSNGLAASTSLEDAALRAILELLERDAFMTAWLTGTPGRRIAIDDALDPALRRVLAALESLAAAVELYLLPTSVCATTALALALGDGHRWPGVTLGLGADLDPHQAVRQAVLELGQTGPYLRDLMRSGALPVPPTPESVREMRDHAAYYFPAGRVGAFDPLRSTTESLTLADLPSPPAADRSLPALASALAAAGLRVALVDVTSPDVATGPFRVLRAVSPDLQPISYGHGLERATVPRVRSQPRTDGVLAIHPIW